MIPYQEDERVETVERTATLNEAAWTNKERRKIATLDRRARWLEARNGGDRDEGEAAAIRWALSTLDTLRAIEVAARAWYEADRAYVEAPFGEDEEEQAVAHVAKDALRDALRDSR